MKMMNGQAMMEGTCDAYAYPSFYAPDQREICLERVSVGRPLVLSISSSIWDNSTLGILEGSEDSYFSAQPS